MAQLGSLIVTITSPTSGATVSGTTTVSASVSIIGSLTVAGVQFKLDGVNLGAEDTTAPYSVSWNTTTASNGSHTLTAVARDMLGVQWTSDPGTVTVFNDTTAPTVSITSPSSGATVGGTITVAASASDNVGVVGVQFKLDGANLDAEDTTAPYSVSWNTTTASNGSHTLTAVARDAAGNRTASVPVTVTVSNATPPTITSFTLTSGPVGASVTITGTNFTGTTAVAFNGVSASFTVNSATSIQATVPTGATSGPIGVTAPGGAATSTSDFVVVSSTPTTYYVSTTGSDSNTGTSTSPWRTIQKAANTLNAGDTVIVNAGTYNERVQITRSGSAGKLITFLAQGTVVMQGFNIPASYVKVAGFEITNTPGTSSTDRSGGSGFYLSGTNNEISGNYIHQSTAAGIYLTSSASNSTIGGNRVAYAVECGIYIQGTNNLIISNDISHTRSDSGGDADGIRFFGSGNTVRKNYIHDIMVSDSPGQSPYINALFTWGPATNYIFEQNLIDKDPSQEQGLTIEASTQPVGDIIVRNNVFITRGTVYNPDVTAGDGGLVTNVTIVNNVMVALNGPVEYAVWLFANVSGAVVKNNATYDHGNSSVPYIQIDFGASGLDIGFNSISKSDGQPPKGSPYPGDLWMVNPLFVNFAARDFHLQSASPLIDRGTTLSQVTNDYDGVARPQGSAYDIGAFEFIGLNPPTITGFTPTSGPVGTSVTISGTNFTGTTAVAFNGVSASFTVNSATSIQATVPGAATTGPISVTTPGGTATSASVFTVTFNDTTPPTVSITSPAPGATVGGTITVAADASDNVGVAGIQFQLDGVNLGAEDTTAPYSVSWNTTTASNGSHTLTAVARDAAGNRTTSAPVTVTVFNDTTPPTMSITSPAPGATVSGTITVTADASDNVGVAGVQFKLDGVNLGAEDTTAPYSVSWDTTTASNSSHTLTAVARDAAGNTATSSAVTVTVFNAAPPTVTSFTPTSGPVGTSVTSSGTNFTGATAVTFNGVSASFTVSSATSIQATVPAGATTGPISVTTPGGTATSASAFTVMKRFEETDPSVTYTAGWTNSTLRPWSGGTAKVSVTAGAQATFTFTGTAVNWIGFRGPQGGIARVFLDGAFVAEIDTYAPAEEVQAIVFSRAGLAAASHTLMIEVNGQKNPSSTDFFIVVDAFDVAVFNDTSPPTVNITSPATGATVSGTITVTAGASDNVGVAGVQFQLDGVNLGADTTAPYSVFWNTTTASNGSHTLTAVARDAAGNRTTSAPVTVTVSNAPSTTTRFEETDPSIVYSAGWTSSTLRPWSGGTAAVSVTAGAQATFTFTGTAVNWIGFRGPQGGIARVSLDGAFVAQIDTYVPTEEVQAIVFSRAGLAAASHTLMVEVTGQKNPNATDFFIIVDAFDVTNPSSPIVVENQQPGSGNWQMFLNGHQTADDVGKQIKGYASATSVNRGESITFYVTVNPAQTYTMDVYRMGWYQGLGGRLMQRIGPLNGVQQPGCPVEAITGLIECPWTSSYTLNVPSSWTSGVFLVQLTNAQGYQNYITFVVRNDARRADILYQQSITTDQAYNNYPNDGATGKSLYEYNSFGANTVAGTPRAVKVSWNRPYAGDGSGNFLNWEYYFVRWLERSGYDVTYSTDLDTHQNSARLLNSKVFLSVGHDEYWSKPMYDGVERARDTGIHLAFFGANDVYWQVRFETSPMNGAADRVMVGYKSSQIDPVQGPTTTVRWRDPFLNRPEQRLVGVQYSVLLPGPNVPYVVANSANWVYAWTGLADGNSIPGLVGYEADSSMPGVPMPDSIAGTYTVLSQSPAIDRDSGLTVLANSSIYQAPSGAWVFGAGTISWSWGLDRANVVDWRIQQMTANMLNRFLGLSPPP